MTADHSVSPDIPLQSTLPDDPAHWAGASDEEPINFTVDSALLRQLGERLVGKPSIALAELVKNSYDADATVVRIEFEEDLIRVIDNGHGMTRDEFIAFWMRVGTSHKESERFSPRFNRSLTGSKGVGRLAVQFLAGAAHIRTASTRTVDQELRARINWASAVSAGDLTSAKMFLHESPSKRGFPDRSLSGTAITLSGLRQQWGVDDLVGLARELWALQPPFVAVRGTADGSSKDERGIRIEFHAVNPETSKAFQRQMNALIEHWEARIQGRFRRDATSGVATAEVILGYAGEQNPERRSFIVPNSLLDSADFEIRVFKLQGKQPAGIRVAEARDYLAKFGGVNVYDAGFRLPYYGVESDWLGIEMDHSHRLSASQLLPASLQVERGLNFLPTNSRLFGVVRVDTSHETRTFGQDRIGPLVISVTRDRLVEGQAFETLRDFVRWGLDYYATRTALRSLAEKKTSEKTDLPTDAKAIEEVRRVLDHEGDTLSVSARRKIEVAVRTALASRKSLGQDSDREAPILLGPLATAGIAALAYDHEVVKQFRLLEGIAEGLHGTASENTELSAEIQDWLTRARATRGLFAHLANAEDREDVRRFNAFKVVKEIVNRARPLIRGIDVDLSALDTAIVLPRGTFAEWSALFQNVLLNAGNAMIGGRRREIAISTAVSGVKKKLLIQDTGSGVSLKDADELFEPFVRKLDLPAERRAFGLGGTGMGLTIVRMIAQARRCEVSFVPPEKGFRTAFQLSWTEAR